MKSQRFSTGYLVRLAVLAAILLMLDMTGLGLIQTPVGIEITTLMIPVIVGAVAMGPAAGGVLGGLFGAVSFWSCFGKSWFGAQLLAISPMATFLTCVPTRILAGLLCGCVFRWLHRSPSARPLALPLASLSGALLNTVLFTSVLLISFFHTEFIQSLAGGANVLAFAAAFVGFNGLVEALACTAVGSVAAGALLRADSARRT